MTRANRPGRDREFVTRLLAPNELRERGLYLGFVEDSRDEISKERRDRATPALDPATGEERSKNVKIFF